MYVYRGVWMCSYKCVFMYERFVICAKIIDEIFFILKKQQKTFRKAIFSVPSSFYDSFNSFRLISFHSESLNAKNTSSNMEKYFNFFSNVIDTFTFYT